MIPKLSRLYADTTLQRCYEAGHDVKKKGINSDNFHFGLWSSPDRLKAWERGISKE